DAGCHTDAISSHACPFADPARPAGRLKPMRPTSQRRNVALLGLAQALFMSVQGMGISATPLAAYSLLPETEKSLAPIPAFLVPRGPHGPRGSRLPADGPFRPPPRFFARGRGRGPRGSGRHACPLFAQLSPVVPVCCAAGHAGGLLLVFPPRRRRCRRAGLPAKGNLAGDGGRRVGGRTPPGGGPNGGPIGGGGDRLR